LIKDPLYLVATNWLQRIADHDTK